MGPSSGGFSLFGSPSKPKAALASKPKAALPEPVTASAPKSVKKSFNNKNKIASFTASSVSIPMKVPSTKVKQIEKAITTYVNGGTPVSFYNNLNFALGKPLAREVYQ